MDCPNWIFTPTFFFNSCSPFFAGQTVARQAGGGDDGRGRAVVVAGQAGGQAGGAQEGQPGGEQEEGQAGQWRCRVRDQGRKGRGRGQDGGAAGAGGGRGGEPKDHGQGE